MGPVTASELIDPRVLRRTVLVVAALNLVWFGVEVSVALAIGSVSLIADSVDVSGPDDGRRDVEGSLRRATEPGDQIPNDGICNLAVFVHGIMKESPELRSCETGSYVRHLLRQTLNLELRKKRGSDLMRFVSM